MKRIILKHGEEDRILRGHPWVFDNEIEKILSGFGPGHSAKRTNVSEGSPPDAKEAVLEPGECVDVEAVRRGKPVYLGRAFANPNSKITARLYSPSKEGADKGFFKRRIREALARRREYIGGGESCRLVFAEADLLPGLIVDMYRGRPAADVTPRDPERGPAGCWLAVQFLCYGVDIRREMIIEALQEVLASVQDGGGFNVKGIIEKPAHVRELEGLECREGIISGSVPEDGIIISENGLLFRADLFGGQKTGAFLDQRDNHGLAAAWVTRLLATDRPPIRILDVFSYSGGFAISALRAAVDSEAIAIDESPAAKETAAFNAGLNGVQDRLRFIQGDAFKILAKLEKEKQSFDLIILDPPAFAKNKPALEGALRGYKEINMKGIRLLRKGGILITCSCSQAVSESRFRTMIADAAGDCGRRLWELDFRGQAADHPVLAGYDESRYLKCAVYRVW